jgi:hypothetical protein
LIEFAPPRQLRRYIASGLLKVSGMKDPDFIGYIEKPDVHDGFVLQVQHNGETARVLVKAYDGHLYTFEFDGVKSVISF